MWPSYIIFSPEIVWFLVFGFFFYNFFVNFVQNASSLPIFKQSFNCLVILLKSFVIMYYIECYTVSDSKENDFFSLISR